MTLSIDVLPAPFGPMIARISWRLISTLISFSALTPPKARLMPSAFSSVSPMVFCAGGVTDQAAGTKKRLNHEDTKTRRSPREATNAVAYSGGIEVYKKAKTLSRQLEVRQELSVMNRKQPFDSF